MGVAGMVVDRVRSKGFRDGVMGTSRGWLAIWLVVSAARLVRRATRHKPEVVYNRVIADGETLIVRVSRDEVVTEPSSA